MAYLFIAHDLGVVRHMSDRIAVMYLGRIVETGPRRTSTPPRSTRTRRPCCRRSGPGPETQRARRPDRPGGRRAEPGVAATGCRFHTRCPYVMECAPEVPPAFLTPGGTTVRCHLHTSGPMLAGAPISTLALAPRNGQRPDPPTTTIQTKGDTP